MRKLTALTICLFAVFVLQAQPDSAKPERHQGPSYATVRVADNKTIRGWLYAANDSQVVLVKSHKALSGFEPGYVPLIIPVEQINNITLQKRNTVLKGALIGLGLGVLSGLVIGFTSGDDDPGWFTMTAKEKATLGAIGLGATGTITGLIIGTLAKKKFIIGHKKETYRDLQGELMLRLVQK